MVAKLMELDRILIGKTVYNSAVEGATASMFTCAARISFTEAPVKGSTPVSML